MPWNPTNTLASTQICFRKLQQPTAHTELLPGMHLKLIHLIADELTDQHSTKNTTTETERSGPSLRSSRLAATVLGLHRSAGAGHTQRAYYRKDY